MVPNGSDLSRSDFCSFVLEALSTNGRDVLKKTLLWDKLQSRKKKKLNRTKLPTIFYYLHFNVNGDLFMGAAIALVF